jgi:hypothetical protein
VVYLKKIKVSEDGKVLVYTEKELHNKYGYLMDNEHGKDTELLIDILKETGLEIIT